MRPPEPVAPAVSPLWALAAFLACAAPALLAYNQTPSPTFLNQALSFFGWGVWLMVWASSRTRLWPLAPAAPGARALGLAAARDAAPLLISFAVLAAAAVWAWLALGGTGGLARSTLATLAAAAVVAWAGALAPRRADAPRVLAALALGLMLGALLSACVGLIQVFLPEWADGRWIAHATLPGRATGNLRQPNHLSTLALWGLLACVVALELRLLTLRWAMAVQVAAIATVVWTASRTGALDVALLAVWGLLDKRLSPASRRLLLLGPVVFALFWVGMSFWGDQTGHTFGGKARLQEGDLSASRFGIWRDTLQLIAAQPWTGVGFGQFNLAWSLSELPQRPVAYFDHTHNLLLQLWVELGLPLGLALTALLLWGLWRAARRAWQRTPEDPAAQGLAGASRAVWMMLALVAVHSLLEYPLWYAYFLLPASWMAGWCLGLPERARAIGEGPAHAAAHTASSTAANTPANTAANTGTHTAAHTPSNTPATPVVAAPPAAATALPSSVLGVWAAGALLVLGSAHAVHDFSRVTAIFVDGPGSAPLEQRLDEGLQSVYFDHHAAYAAATLAQPGPQALPLVQGASRFLLDGRLMSAWARALQASGDPVRAAYLADRLREFKRPESQELLAECTLAQAAGAADPAAAAVAARFPCAPAPAGHGLGWRAFAGSR